MKKLVLCIDLGSSSVRCSLFEMEPGHNLVLSVAKPWEAVRHGKIQWWQPQQDDNSKDLNSEDLNNAISLLDLVDQSIDEILEKLASSTSTGSEESSSPQIVAVGFSSLVMNLIGVDQQGNVIPHATLSYACNDALVATKVKALQSHLGNEALQDLYQKTGTPMHTAYALPQLLVLYQNQPSVVSRVAQWQTLSSLCLAKWTQRQNFSNDNDSPFWPISYSEASWTGLLNIQTCNYEPAVLELLPEACRRTLPRLEDFDFHEAQTVSSTPTSLLRPLYAQKWPALATTRTTRFFLGIGDGACANIGSKCTSAARMACTIGTSAAARVVLINDSASAVAVPRGLFCYRIHRDSLLLGGALTDGGSVIAWIRQVLNISSNDDMQQCLIQVSQQLQQDYAVAATSNTGESNQVQQQRPPLIMLPFLSGERSTNFQTGATGAMVGLTTRTTRAQLLQACLESVTLRLAAIARLLSSPQAEIWVSGKALEVNEVWRQMIADCTGRVVVLDPDTAEGSSRGVACLVAASMSGLGLVEEAVSPNAVKTLPRSEGKVYWEKLVVAQERLLDALRPIYAGI